jgi:hypothetical protein
MGVGYSKGFWVAHNQKLTRGETIQGACKLLISGQPGLSASLAEILAEPQLGGLCALLLLLTPQNSGRKGRPLI